MRLFSTEQVSKYHPDKYADQISDAILTECLKQDAYSHVACETMVKDKTVFLAGEITTTAEVNYEQIAKRVGKKLGYEVNEVINYIRHQSEEINKAVLGDKNIGAGDQGIMFGYATRETESRLPKAFDYANKIIQMIERDVPNGILKGDAKCQVTIDLDTNQIMETLISACHTEAISVDVLRVYMHELLQSSGLHDQSATFKINPAGSWTIGGPEADCGLTGRKIVCDQYGGYVPVGGGAFSGKDPTKVDRSASYMARQIAVDLLEKFELEECEIQLGYAIGVAQPVSVYVKANTKVDLLEYIKRNYDLTPRGIIKHLNLYDTDYERLAEGCHYR